MFSSEVSGNPIQSSVKAEEGLYTELKEGSPWLYQELYKHTRGIEILHHWLNLSQQKHSVDSNSALYFKQTKSKQRYEL